MHVVLLPAGDFGELEEPTSWEVQDAILRIKSRERRHGLEDARADMDVLRSHEVSGSDGIGAALQCLYFRALAVSRLISGVDLPL